MGKADCIMVSWASLILLGLFSIITPDSDTQKQVVAKWRIKQE